MFCFFYLNLSLTLLTRSLHCKVVSTPLSYTGFTFYLASLIKGLTSGDSELQAQAEKEADEIIGKEQKQKVAPNGFDKSQINKYEEKDSQPQNVNILQLLAIRIDCFLFFYIC